MKKMIIIMILCLSVLAIRGINREKELTQRVSGLQVKVSDLTTELQSTKAEIIQLELRQAVAEDISDRAGWK